MFQALRVSGISQFFACSKPEAGPPQNLRWRKQRKEFCKKKFGKMLERMICERAVKFDSSIPHLRRGGTAFLRRAFFRFLFI
jgi:hypothetical protein